MFTLSSWTPIWEKLDQKKPDGRPKTELINYDV